MKAHRPGPQYGPDFNLRLYHQTHYRQAFFEAAARDDVRPFVFPWGFVGSFFLPVLYLSFPHVHRPWLYRLRWAVAATILYLHIRLAQTTTASDEAVSYVAGLVAVWSTIWSFNLLLFTRPQWDAARVVCRKRKATEVTRENGTENGEKTPGKQNGSQNGLVNRFKKQAPPQATPEEKSSLTATTAPDESVAAALAQGNEYVWQPYPADAPFLTRFAWFADLVTTFRGTGWNWAIPSVPHFPPPPPPPPSSTTQPSTPVRLDQIPVASRAGTTRSTTYAAFLRSRLTQLALTYFILDVMITAFRRDPYFMMGPEYPAHETRPPLVPELYVGLLPAACWSRWWCLEHVVPTIRHLTGFVAVMAGLHFYAAVAQVVYVTGLPALLGGRGSERARSWLGTYSDLWQYPDVYGGFVEGVLDRGLAGFWGSWWHQTFRAGFVAPGRWLERIVFSSKQVTNGAEDQDSTRRSDKASPTEEQPRTNRGELSRSSSSSSSSSSTTRAVVIVYIEMFLAFLLSGLLHAVGGHTCVAHRMGFTPVYDKNNISDQLPPRRRWEEPVYFFLLQPVGVLVQSLLSHIFSHLFSRLPSAKTNKLLRRAANFVFTFLWLKLSGHLLFDDFSRAGLWMFEPIPVSFLQLLVPAWREPGYERTWLRWGRRWKPERWERGGGFWGAVWEGMWI
jgi:hypothetical protein